MATSGKALESDEFLDDEPGTQPSAEAEVPGWPMLIVDDEPGIHDITRIALSDVRFKHRPLELISCFSAAEALAVMRARSDIALILLDVVMETDDAGLRCVHAIRKELGNRYVRIILRTGQPGVAPERQVIEDYDINDYKAKTELTRDKLHTAVVGSLRSFDDIMTIEENRRVIDANRRGLLKVMDASSTIFRAQSMRRFSQGVLEQLAALLFADQDILFAQAGGMAAFSHDAPLQVVSATGRYAPQIGREVSAAADARLRPSIARAVAQRRSVAAPDHYVGFFRTASGTDNVLVVDGPMETAKSDTGLVDLFCSNVGIAYENLMLRNEVEETQRDIIYRLGEVVESRSQETGNHVRRMAEYCHVLALAMNLGEEEAEIIRIAAPMHDIGKVGIPDAILNKPGRYTEDERTVMQSHAAIGFTMLKDAKPRILKAAAVIAGQHHEKWDGSGYPNGLGGDGIHIYARIAALSDVFDALASDRCYKKAWEMPRVLDLIRSERGRHFDPAVVDAFFGSFDDLDAIRRRYVDRVSDDAA